MSLPKSCLLSAILCLPVAQANAAVPPPADPAIDEVIITATLREQREADVAASIAVLDSGTLRAAGQQHFADVMAMVPNLNFAGASSRPRYFQVRGIGELEQYEGAPNPSVGFLIDDMDFSGLGMAATLFDVAQVEVLRGPQGARYGANALGGLINVTSTAPSDAFNARVNASLGTDAGRGAGGVLNLPLPTLDSAVRLGVQRQRADGFRDNTYLGRSDTNGRDETTARARWHWQAGAETTLDASLLHVDLDNGYDAFAIDNSRTVLSDNPGEDSQRATGASLRLATPGPGDTRVRLSSAHVQSDSVHAYDGDWGNAESWAPYTYDYTYRALRGRDTTTLEARLESAAGPEARVAWLVGAWHQQLRESITERSTGRYADPDFPEFDSVSDFTATSRYRAQTLALFGQLDLRLGGGWQASLGLRQETRDARFRATDTDLAPRDKQWGGHLTLSHALGTEGLAWLGVTRGFKAGGVNPSPQLPARLREFGPEHVSGVELGIRQSWLAHRVRGELVLFHMQRQDLQVRTNEQLVLGDPNTFVFFTDNAARGRNQGAEVRLDWLATPQLSLGIAAGLLRATVSGVQRDGLTLPTRDAPHAPRWQFATHVAWEHPSGVFLRADVTGMDAFYFGNLPNADRSAAYALTHVRAGWRGERLEVAAYVRNLFNRDYAVRGFSFGNEPPDFPEKLYTQPGDPREGGLTVSWQF